MDYIPNENVDEIVCPYCGHEHGDTDDLEVEDERAFYFDCESCGKEMMVQPQLVVEYTTTKSDREQNTDT